MATERAIGGEIRARTAHIARNEKRRGQLTRQLREIEIRIRTREAALRDSTADNPKATKGELGYHRAEMERLTRQMEAMSQENKAHRNWLGQN